MGVHGWDEIQDGVTLKGTVVGNAFVSGSDNDWDFKVEPGIGYEYLLTNRDGYTNTKGSDRVPTVECEVLVEYQLGAEQETLDKYLGNLDGQWVNIMGTWARDNSHEFDGTTVVVAGPAGGNVDDKGKTEIHPIVSILVERRPAVDNMSRSIEFLVFSPAGKILPLTHSLHAGENRTSAFDMPIPLGSTHQIIRELDMSASKAFSVQNSGRFDTLHCEVSSGLPGDGKGFYFAQISLPGFTLLSYLASRGLPFALGIRDLMARANVPSLRALFNRMDTGGFKYPQCIALQEEMDTIQRKIDAIKKPPKTGPGHEQFVKPPQDPALKADQKGVADLEKQLSEVYKQGKDCGCF